VLEKSHTINGMPPREAKLKERYEHLVAITVVADSKNGDSLEFPTSLK
jgi:hypothetical protein